MAVKGSATTHAGPGLGPGGGRSRKVRSGSWSRPTMRPPRAGRINPGYLKSFGSRPASKGVACH